MRNVFSLFAEPKSDFNAIEKGLLDEVQALFEEQGFSTRLSVNSGSRASSARFLHEESSDFHLLLVKRRIERGFEYDVTFKGRATTSFLDFTNAAIACRNHVRTMRPGPPGAFQNGRVFALPHR